MPLFLLPQGKKLGISSGSINVEIEAVTNIPDASPTNLSTVITDT